MNRKSCGLWSLSVRLPFHKIFHSLCSDIFEAAHLTLQQKCDRYILIHVYNNGNLKRKRVHPSTKMEYFYVRYAVIEHLANSFRLAIPSANDLIVFFFCIFFVLIPLDRLFLFEHCFFSSLFSIYDEPFRDFGYILRFLFCVINFETCLIVSESLWKKTTKE